jgi:hypothetical protein
MVLIELPLCCDFYFFFSLRKDMLRSTHTNILEAIRPLRILISLLDRSDLGNPLVADLMPDIFVSLARYIDLNQHKDEVQIVSEKVLFFLLVPSGLFFFFFFFFFLLVNWTGHS